MSIVGAPDFFPSQGLEKPKLIQTITQDDLDIGAPTGPAPKEFYEIPHFLTMCNPLATGAETAFAAEIRKKFSFDGYPDPSMSDIIRSFRCIKGASTYIEVGIFDRGNLAYVSSFLSDDALIVGVDTQAEENRDDLLRKTLKPGQRYVSVIGNSRAPETVRQVKDVIGSRIVDAVFIDGDHTAFGAMCDYVNFGEMVRRGGHVLFHDSLWEGDESYKGVSAALTEIDKVRPVYLVPARGGRCYRFMPAMFRDPLWGVVGICPVP